MRVVTESAVPGFPIAIAGERSVLRFSQAEIATLRRASRIADEARDLWRAAVAYDVDGESLDTELAMISIAVDEVAGGIAV